MNLSGYLIAPGLGCALILAAMAGPATAKSTAPAGLAGSWRGAGLVQAENGQQERVKCRAHYRKSGPDRYEVKMKCVSRSKGSRSRVFAVKKSGGNLFTGRFRDEEVKLDITAAIRLEGSRQVVEIRSKKGWGRIELSR